MIRKTLEENGLLEVDDAERIFNVNESDINMGLRQGKGIKKDSKNVHSLSKGSHDHITVSISITQSISHQHPVKVGTL